MKPSAKEKLLCECLTHRFTDLGGLDDHEVSVTASLGICLYDGEDGHSLLRNADAAMYRAKENSRDDYHFYTQELTKNAFERVLLENSLRQAISNDEFYLVYQPQICL